MFRMMDAKFGFWRHFTVALIFLLGCHLNVYADPISWTAIGISLAISAATTAASYLVTAILTPKPKPQDKNKIQGEVKISNCGEDLHIDEIAGKIQPDGFGGFHKGTIYFYASRIRGSVTETNAGSGGGGGGGKGFGGKKTQTVREHHYHIDLACLAARGRNRILEIRAGTDVLYKNYPKPDLGTGTHYQAETASLSGTLPVADSNFSAGFKVPLDANDTATFSVAGDGQTRAFYIVYACPFDGKYLNVTINGTAHTIAVPNTYGRIESVMLLGATNVGATTVFIHSPNNGVELDKIIVGTNFASETVYSRFGGLSGIQDVDWTNTQPTYNHMTLRDPYAEDWRPFDEYNYQPNPNGFGEVSDVALPAGAQLRIYEGSLTQLPDPMLQAHFESKYGAGATPAFRNRTYFVLENFEITKYQQVPNLTVVVESIDLVTLGDLYENRSKRVGLEPDEYNYDALKVIPLRGLCISNRQAPRTEIEVLNRVLDVDIVEDSDGKIVGVAPDETVVAQIPYKMLDASEDSQTNERPRAVEIEITNDYEVPRQLDLSFFDAKANFKIGNVKAARDVTVSQKKENIETSLVLTQEEAQKMVDREHQRIWCEKNPVSFTTFYRYGWIQPTQLVEVEDEDGFWTRVRIKSVNGAVPGKLRFSGVERDVFNPYERIFQRLSVDPLTPNVVKPPGNIYGTLIDEALLRTTETVSGVYAAAYMTDQAYEWNGASLYWERESGYELLTTVLKQATMGRTVAGAAGTLGNVPGGWSPGAWDEINTVTLDLAYGALESRTEAEVLDRANAIVIGSEIISFVTATRVNGFPNRWTISKLQRQLQQTVSTGHAATERAVLLTDAVKFIPLDSSEYGVTRNFKYVSSGQTIASASSFEFTWDGKTNYFAPPPAIVNLTMSEHPVTAEDGTINISVYGQATFGDFPFDQSGKLWWKKPGDIFREIQTVFADENGVAGFEVPNLAVGEHKAKVVAFNGNVPQAAAATEYPVILDGKDDNPNPVSGFTLTYDGAQYKGKFTEPADRDIKGFNIYDAADVFQFFINATEFSFSSELLSLTLKVKTLDTSEHESAAVSATGSISAASLEKLGAATLTEILLNVKDSVAKAVKRKIEVSTSAGFTAGTVTTTERDLTLATSISRNIEKITRAYSATPETVYVRISESTDGTNYGSVSPPLPVEFENELNDGVPVLQGAPTVTLVGSTWLFGFPKPLINGFTANNVQFSALNHNIYKNPVYVYSAAAATIEVNEVNLLPTSGRMYNSVTGEIFSYTGISGHELTGVVRGRDGTTATAMGVTDRLYLIAMQEELGNVTKHQVPRASDTYGIIYRWQNSYKESGEDGWSLWSDETIAWGTASGNTNAVPPPPGAEPPPPPLGYEDPSNPVFNKRNPYLGFLIDY